MDTAVVGVMGTLLGGLVGGFLTHWNSTALAKFEMKWQQVRLRQEKLEEISELLDQIQHHFNKLMGEVILKVETDKPLDQSGERIPFDRLKILMEFYAPAMLDDWQQLEHGREVFGKVLVDAISSVHLTKPKKQEINGRAVTAAGMVSKVCRSFSEKAAFLAHEAVQDQTANNILQRLCSFAARRRTQALGVIEEKQR